MTDSVRRRVLASLALAAALPLGAQAQTWPAKPIRIIVAYPAGGVSDVVARALGDKLSERLGTAVVVENKAGAGGTIGMDAVAKAAPDGYTLGFSAISPLVLNPHLGTPPYDATRDIVPVASVMYSPVLLLGTQAAKERDFRSLLATAKAQPGQVRWATSGLASLGHIMLEHIMQGSGVQITHVPYKGGGQQLNDALSGQFEVLSTNAGPAVMQQIKAGKLHPLAVGAPARLTTLPNVPTLGELGLPAANLNSVFGMFAPAGVPAAVLERLNAEINRALALPDIQARLEASDNVPTGGSAEAFRRQIAAESQRNARIIRAANIRLN
ncbi:tripartite tricarboxylate transporter substrate binding protein [Diaphorobacter sp. MNS-0]|uniref:Bug family tripartite tricarboxylate transporter substrate binding protein n=1 Tax=Diaphorobacter sp. MNS-0 TaxID=2866628 RepID=UPI001C7302C6|nr:tripartite tricarboxylate transporter substrate binding protein [Diaphorobacter sp. MNS-0]QYY26544.1 tripartite tricarboxylate transporter substrate binding protein [Diaphorobacter sp. MNS-0]